MFRFENEIYLYGLLIIPLLLLIFIGMMIWRRRAKNRFAHPALLDKLAPAGSNGKLIAKFTCASIALAFFVLGLANPQIGTSLKKAERKGIDLFFALDISRSMLAEDIKPNRLDRAKRAIGQIIDQLGTDRIGLVVFAGDAYLQLPLTTDLSAAKMLLNTVSTEIAPQQGTAIGAAIERALEGYTDDTKKHKAMIVISDGEDWEGEALDAAKKAQNQGVVIHTVGMGTPSGGPIPIQKKNRRYDFHHNQAGEVVVTKLDEETLQKIARAGGGEYIYYSGGRNDLQNILQAIGAMEKKEFEEKVYTDYADKYQYCLAIGLLFLLIEFFISERRSRWLARLFQD